MTLNDFISRLTELRESSAGAGLLPVETTRMVVNVAEIEQDEHGDLAVILRSGGAQ